MKKFNRPVATIAAALIIMTSTVPAFAATPTSTNSYYSYLVKYFQQYGIQLASAPTPTPTPAPTPAPAPTPTPTPAPTPAPAPTPTPTPTPTSTTGTPNFTAPVTSMELQMVNLVNQERTKNGLQPLTIDMRLVKIARMKSYDMIKNNYFGHQSPTYGSPFDMLKANGITYKAAGENLAGAGTVDRAHTSLMNSAGHRANILSPKFTKIGIGIIQGGPYGLMITQHFIG